MDWSSINASRAKVSIARNAITCIPDLGVSAEAFDEAYSGAGLSGSTWREYFPGGLTDALWFISEASDSSMARDFVGAPAPDLAAVINIRFIQNRELKPFVRRVMVYDFFHPIQAVARMQRTARMMYSCLGRMDAPSKWRVAALNILYTFLVMVWLADRTQQDRVTKGLTRIVARL